MPLPSSVESYDDIRAKYDPSKNTTRPILSKYEKAKIVGLRLQQIARGAETMVDVKLLTNPSARDVVMAELDQKLLPFIVVRTLPNGVKEHWRVKDMIVGV